MLHALNLALQNQDGVRSTSSHGCGLKSLKKKSVRGRGHHVFLSDKTADEMALVSEAKKSAKRAVTIARATQLDDFNERLESRDGERFLYRLEKVRHRQTEDVEKFSSAVLWKSKFWYSTEWLETSFNQVIGEESARYLADKYNDSYLGEEGQFSRLHKLPPNSFDSA
ncbi:unnamed protein product [Heligmosomoides polygyrus]|uniref:Uncharacterized protein n=1 Tax=Heligmosomoides polygyrus TaxID=6339 RepID=A0A183GCX4_HELPZ|nr:unnamed protein product [Heligmosomoides polygyrus]